MWVEEGFGAEADLDVIGIVLEVKVETWVNHLPHSHPIRQWIQLLLEVITLESSKAQNIGDK